MKQIISLILFLMPTFILAQQYGSEIKDASVLLDKLRHTSDLTQTIMSDFTLEKKMAMMAQLEKSYGKFYYSRLGAKICLDYIVPKNNKIIIDNSKFILVNSGKVSSLDTSKNPALSHMKNMITACMTGNFISLGEHSETHYFDDNKYFTIVINPSNKRVKRYMNEIVLRFDKNDNTLYSMCFIEKNGDYSEYSYTNKIINNNIDNKVFNP